MMKPSFLFIFSKYFIIKEKKTKYLISICFKLNLNFISFVTFDWIISYRKKTKAVTFFHLMMLSLLVSSKRKELTLNNLLCVELLDFKKTWHNILTCSFTYMNKLELYKYLPLRTKRKDLKSTLIEIEKGKWKWNRERERKKQRKRIFAADSIFRKFYFWKIQRWIRKMEFKI